MSPPDYDDTLVHAPRPADNVEKLREWAASLARDGHKPRVTITLDPDSWRAYLLDSHRESNGSRRGRKGIACTVMAIPGGGAVELKPASEELSVKVAELQAALRDALLTCGNCPSCGLWRPDHTDECDIGRLLEES